MTKTSIIMIDDAPMNVGIVQPVIEMSVIPAGSDMPESSLKSKKDRLSRLSGQSVHGVGL